MRSEAQRAAFTKWAPQTNLAGVGKIKVLDALVGQLLLYELLGLILRYSYSFRSNIDNQVYHAGEVVAQGQGTAFARGSEWACRGDRLRVLEGIDVKDVEGCRAGHCKKARRPTDVEPCAGIENAGR